MDISSGTKISALIKANPASIEAIVSINKHFEKLRNPILRKILASRVTIADAAKMGGCSVDDFFNKLIPLGFTVQDKKPITPGSLKISEPEFMKSVTSKNTTTLDVRIGLTSGQDPFNKIMEALSTMPQSHTLLIINSFEPIPLINIMRKKGFEHFTDRRAENLVHTYFKNSGTKNNKDITGDTPKGKNEGDLSEMLERFEGRMKTIDVRELEMPIPMVKILEELEKLSPGHALFVYHKKVPIFLLPELEERKYLWLSQEISEGNVQLLIYK